MSADGEFLNVFTVCLRYIYSRYDQAIKADRLGMYNLVGGI